MEKKIKKCVALILSLAVIIGTMPMTGFGSLVSNAEGSVIDVRNKYFYINNAVKFLVHVSSEKQFTGAEIYISNFNGSAGDKLEIDNQTPEYDVSSMDTGAITINHTGLPQDFDNLINNIKITANSPETKTVEIYMYSSGGDEQTTVSIPVRSDSSSPEILSVTNTGTSWTKNASVTVNAQDDSALAYEAYSFDGGISWQKDNYKFFSDYKKLNAGDIVVRDELGKQTAYASSVEVLADSSGPKVNAVNEKPALNVYTNDKVTVSVDASDAGCGIDKYCFDGSNWQAGDSYDYTENTTIPANTIKVRDKLGNVTLWPYEIKINNIDKIKPVIKSVDGTEFKNTDGSWSMKLTISAEDKESGIADEGYSFDNGATYQKENTKTYTAPDGAGLSDIISNVVVRVKDKAGSASANRKAPPVIKNVALMPDDAYSQQDKGVCLRCDYPDPNYNKYQWSFDGGKTWENTNTKFNYTENQTIPAGMFMVKSTLGGTTVYNTDFIIDKIDKSPPVIDSVDGVTKGYVDGDVTVTVHAHDDLSGITYYMFTGEQNPQTSNAYTFTGSVENAGVGVIDAAGNFAVYNLGDILIDKTFPNAPTVENAQDFTDSIWHNTNQTIKVSFDKTDGASEKLQMCYDNTDWVNSPDEIGCNWSMKHVYRFRVIDALGRTSAETRITMQVDKDAPTINSGNVEYTTVNDTPLAKFANFITFGVFFKESVRVRVDVQDDMSGADKLWYKLGTGEVKSTTDEKDGKFCFDIPVDSGFEGDITLYGEDKAGNKPSETDYFIIKNFCVDKDMPTCTVTPDSRPNENGWYNKPVNCTIKVQDVKSGLNSVCVKLNGVKQDVSIDSFASQETGQKVLTLNNVGSIPSGSGEYKIDIDIYDNAGNHYGVSVPLKVDTEKPLVEITGTDGSWTNKEVTLKFGNANNNVKSGVKFYYTTAADDTGWTEADSLQIKSNTNAAYRVKAVTGAGLVSESSQIVRTAITNDIGIKGADAGNEYYIARKFDISAGFAPIKSIVYTVDGGAERVLSVPYEIKETGNIVLTVTDEAGNSKKLSYVMKAIPSSGDITLSEENKALINRVIGEFAQQKSVLADEAYKSDINAKIMSLTDCYNSLEFNRINNNVKDIKADSVNADSKQILETAKADLGKLPLAGTLNDSMKTSIAQKGADIDSLLKIIDDTAKKIGSINASVRNIAKENATSDNSAAVLAAMTDIESLLSENNLTAAQRTALGNKRQELIATADRIKEVSDKIAEIEKVLAGEKASNIKLSDEKLFAETSGSIDNLLGTNNLTAAQRQKLETGKAELTSYIAIIESAKKVMDNITALPDASNIARSDKNKVLNAKNEYDKLSETEKDLVDGQSKDKLEKVLAALSKILMHDEDTDTFAEYAGGNSFAPGTELSVELITSKIDEGKKKQINSGIQIAANGSQLVELYDIKLLLDNQHVKPNGDVKIKIRLTEEQKKCSGLQVAYIDDSGNVTIIPHTVQGDYIVFVTNHFSYYGIIGKKVKTDNADTGDPYGLILPFAVCAAIVAAAESGRRKKKKKD